jgi:hypothetical protein
VPKKSAETGGNRFYLHIFLGVPKDEKRWNNFKKLSNEK